ncbi:hypothetical protein J8I87_14420 [Paraburkholderia sp. LEh10]|uniref:hypothetical protein n=1 Tax=Paraburkholderia sp. LEh10 TaxID=2821353 RepID=UPI001AE2FDE3|nr:hypothetical protein [Paraburkholderia sp. LEh10]MBP0590884.1 hypothetical protein [Paraburkholderia sp. LEh10]
MFVDAARRLRPEQEDSYGEIKDCPPEGRHSIPRRALFRRDFPCYMKHFERVSDVEVARARVRGDTFESLGIVMWRRFWIGAFVSCRTGCATRTQLPPHGIERPRHGPAA